MVLAYLFGRIHISALAKARRSALWSMPRRPRAHPDRLPLRWATAGCVTAVSPFDASQFGPGRRSYSRHRETRSNRRRVHARTRKCDVPKRPGPQTNCPSGGQLSSVSDRARAVYGGARSPANPLAPAIVGTSPSGNRGWSCQGDSGPGSRSARHRLYATGNCRKSGTA